MTPGRPVARDSQSFVALGRRPLIVLLVTLLVYLPLFWSSGGQRQQFYETIAKGYLLIPDQLAIDLWDTWRGAASSSEPSAAETSAPAGSAAIDSAEKSSATAKSASFPSTLIGVFDRLPLLLVALLWLTAALGAGWLSLSRGLRRELNAIETIALSALIGLQWLSLYTLVLGLAGLVRQSWLFWIPGVLLPLTASYRAWQQGAIPSWSSAVHRLQQLRARPFSSVTWSLAFLVPTVLMLALAAVPPWDFDVREYHLQVPKEWFQAGRITFLPHNVYGNMPLGAELHALAASALVSADVPGLGWEPAWWYGALIGKLIIASYALIAAVGIYGLVSRAAGVPTTHKADEDRDQTVTARAAWSGRLAALAFLATPWIVDVSTVGMNEGAVAAYAIWALWALLRSGDSRGGMLTAGFLAGSAVACKYTAVVMIVVPLVAIALWLTGPRRQAMLVAVLTFGLGCLIACGPWLLKNAALAGNPTYPLLYPVLGGRDWDEATHERWQRAHRAPHDAVGHQYHPRQAIGSLRVVGWESEKLSPVLWPLAVVGMVCAPRSRLKSITLGLLVFSGLAWWLLTHRLERFLVPALPLLCCLLGLGVMQLQTLLARRVLLALVAFSFIMNMLFVASPAMLGDKRLLVPLADFRRDTVTPPRLNPVHRFLNEHVEQGQRALLIGDAQVFDLEVPVTYHTCWNRCPLDEWLVDRDPAARREALRRRNIQYVYIHWPEIERYRSPGNYGFPSVIAPQWVEEELVARDRILRPIALPTIAGTRQPPGQLYEVLAGP